MSILCILTILLLKYFDNISVALEKSKLLEYGASNCDCKFQDSDFLSKLCCLKPPYNDLMPIKDRILRNDCNTSDACNRFQNIHIPDGEVFDYIVVGGGVAGPVIAGRLCKSYKVLLIEAGPEEPTGTTIPTHFMDARGSELDWNYVTVMQDRACQSTSRVCNWPRGKMLSGTSGMSGSMYTRGSPWVFNQWVEEGCVGWGYEDLLQYFIRSEKNLDIEAVENHYHGFNGTNYVSYCPHKSDLIDVFLEAGNELGYPTVDICGEHQIGFTRAQLLIKNGQRASTNRMYLRPNIGNKNLTVLINTLATKVIIDSLTMKATGVQYLDDCNNLKIANARREVILSAGVIGSAQLLMLSGIGPAEHLKDVGIDVLNDLPVGKNLHHHVSVGLNFFMDVKSTNHDSSFYDNIMEFIKFKKGPLASTGVTQVTAFIESSMTQPGVPDLQFFFDGINESCTCITKTRGGCAGKRRKFCKKCFTARPTFLMSKSKGFIKLQSKNPTDYPLIQPNYLHDPQDIPVLIEGIYFIQNLLNTATLKAYGTENDEEQVKGCESYPYGSYEYWVCVIVHHTGPENHHAGTCKMGPPDDETAVVDLELKVKGFTNLRVVDASVFRLQPNANPISTIIVFAEKTTDLILEDANNYPFEQL